MKILGDERILQKNILHNQILIETFLLKIELLTKRIEFLEKENAELKERLSKYETRKNSHNSSIPPSHDENRPIKNKSLRNKSDKPIGGQKGHEGNTLEMTDIPDEVQHHEPFYCKVCGNDISEVPSEYVGRRQVIDLPPIKPIVTEHRIYEKTCSCGHVTESNYPQGVNTPVSYGNKIEGLIGYFHTRQYVPFKRMQEIFQDIFFLPISEGGIHYLLDRLTAKSLPAYEIIRSKVFSSDVIGTDETGVKVNGKKNWYWTWQTPDATLIALSDNRGITTIKENQQPSMGQAVLVHDCWKAHFHTPATTHQLCVAHLLRELNYLEERYKTDWPGKFKSVLMDALELKKQLTPCDYYVPNKVREKLERKLSKLLTNTVNKKHKEIISFQNRMKKYQNYIFTFLYHPKVPPDNNDSEKAIRNVKVKQKVSGQFKSMDGAKIFAVLRSITDTALKNGQNVLQALNVVANLKVQTD